MEKGNRCPQSNTFLYKDSSKSFRCILIFHSRFEASEIFGQGLIPRP